MSCLPTDFGEGQGQKQNCLGRCHDHPSERLWWPKPAGSYGWLRRKLESACERKRWHGRFQCTNRYFAFSSVLLTFVFQSLFSTARETLC